MSIEVKFYCDHCNEEIDIDDGVHDSHETDYARTQIVMLTCQCGKKYRYWMDGSTYFEYDEEEDHA